MAYMSGAQGPFEIYVRPLEGDGGPWRVSTGGGAHPVWSKSSSELLFTTEDQILTARYRYDGREFKVEPPRAWSAVRYATAGPTRKFDLHPDGARVVVAGPQTADDSRARHGRPRHELLRGPRPAAASMGADLPAEPLANQPVHARRRTLRCGVRSSTAFSIRNRPSDATS